MRLALVVLLAVLLPTASGSVLSGSALSGSTLPGATPESTRGMAGVVTREEYAQVRRGMTRVRVERIFGAGRSCVYLKYELDNVLFIGRQYRGTAGTEVAISYERPGDGGRARVVHKWWPGFEPCFDDDQ